MKEHYEEGSLQEKIRKDIIKSKKHLRRMKFPKLNDLEYNYIIEAQKLLISFQKKLKELTDKYKLKSEEILQKKDE